MKQSAEIIADPEKRQIMADLLEQIRSNSIATLDVKKSDCSEILSSYPVLFEEFCKALADNTSIEAMYFHDSGLGSPQIAVLAPALANHPLRILNLHGNEIDAEGMKTLAEALHGHASLASIAVGMNPHTPESYHHLSNLLENTALANLCFVGTQPIEGSNALYQKAMELRNPNLIEIDPNPGGDVQKFMQKNINTTWMLATRIKKTDEASWDKGFIFNAYRRRHAMYYCEHMQEVERQPGDRKILERSWRKLDEFITTLPPAPASLSLAALTTVDNNGYSPLDNPSLWNGFAEISQKLVVQGTPITKDFLLQPDKEGNPHIHAGIRAGKLSEMIEAIGMNGETLTADDLLETDRSPGSLLKLIIDEGQLPQLFTEQNWNSQPPEARKAVYRALPEAAKAQITNLHALAASSRPAQQYSQR